MMLVSSDTIKKVGIFPQKFCLFSCLPLCIAGIELLRKLRDREKHAIREGRWCRDVLAGFPNDGSSNRFENPIREIHSAVGIIWTKVLRAE